MVGSGRRACGGLESPHTVRFPELSLFTGRGVIHASRSSWCDSVAGSSSLPFAVSVLDRVVCRDRAGSHHFCHRVRALRSAARVTHRTGHDLHAMPVDTRRVTHAAGTQPGSKGTHAHGRTIKAKQGV